MLPTIILSLCLNYSDSTLGAYTRSTNVIEICERAPDKKMVLTHELGHFVWHKLFTEEDRKEFEVETKKYTWQGELYYGQGVSEDFAILFERTFYYKYDDYPELTVWLKKKIKSIKKKKIIDFNKK